MIHDTASIDAALASHKSPPPRLALRVGRALGLVREEAPAPDPEPLPPPAQEEPGIEALAAQLAELIASAQSRVDGAALLIGRSADEAQAYRQALTSNAQLLDTTASSTHVAAALIDVTRSMIDRTRGAEERLRSMGEELHTLQRDLEDARESAERDSLTGLPNRRALETALKAAVASARRADQMLSVAFCDIDRFKQLNDRHGHAVGDRVLRLVGDCLADGAGEGVFVGRQGGEEFVMLFEGHSADEAAARVDTIRARLHSRALRSRTSEEPIGQISFSAGVAMLSNDEAGEDLIRRADRALYRAKANGRNREEIDRLP